MPTYTVVTTFNASGYQLYGQRMIQSFLQNWPSTVTLYVYAEGCSVEETALNLKVFDLEQESSKLVAFKQRWKNVPKANGDVSQDPVRSKRKDAGKGFKWDAIRFSHKVYAIFDAAVKTQDDFLIWMDADNYCHSPVSQERIEQLIPVDKDLCYLGRKGKFSECGLYAMNLGSPNIQKFLQAFEYMYEDAENGIFTLAEWHDSFVFDAVRNSYPELHELNWSAGLVVGEGHPLINSEWGAYLDHLKGARKQLGHSKKSDLLATRNEEYWNVIARS
jgi:hypothetical protein